jgi:phage tail-like protein
MSEPTQFRFVRDRRDWEATLSALEPDDDGNLMLARLPGPADGVAVALPPPYAPGVSGIAAGPCDAVFIADTTGNCLLFVDGLCDARAQLPPAPAPATAGAAPGQFNRPRGLAVDPDGVWVADSANARVQHWAFPALELDREFTDGLRAPSGVTVDRAGRVYVLDSGSNSVRRYGANGLADLAFNAAVAATGRLADPVALAVDSSDRLLVSDGAGAAVRRFDGDGRYLGDLAGPGEWQPTVLTAGDRHLFVADATSGRIEVFSAEGTHWCPLPGFGAPVTALAVSPTGDLLIKTALDAGYLRWPVATAFAAEGSAIAGPFDAGEALAWRRAACLSDAADGTSVAFDLACTDTATAPPSWTPAPAPDCLIPDCGPHRHPDGNRYIWLRATLTTSDPATSPILRNLRAQTAIEDYRDYLPATYLRADEPPPGTDHQTHPDAPTRFLYRLLALAQTELAGVEENIDAEPWLLSPHFAPHSDLAWLAEWLDLELPRVATDAERRALIQRAVALYQHRGTPAGIRDFVEIYTGIRPSIAEAFEMRGLWVLDLTSRLGFDTGLPAIDPLGMVVPDASHCPAPGTGACTSAIGATVVGEAGPLPAGDLGATLFLDSAHRFTVYLPACRSGDSALIAEVRRIIDAERPAHTDYHLCLVEPDLRVGFQSTVGVDTIVGGPPSPLRLGGARLGQDATLGGGHRRVNRIGDGSIVGNTTVLK